jgi:hypothetical protein
MITAQRVVADDINRMAAMPSATTSRGREQASLDEVKDP